MLYTDVLIYPDCFGLNLRRDDWLGAFHFLCD